VKDGPGFYTTRILAPYLAEAGFLLEEGASVEEIDRALLQYGFPVGPLQLLDEIGIDVGAKVAAVLAKAFGARMTPPQAFARLHADGRSGRKNGKGFYLYAPAGSDAGQSTRKGVDATVDAALGVGRKPGAIGQAEIAERLSLQMINEAVHCLGEGILRSPRDGDVGAILGLGFPPFRGGPFHTADALGVAELVARLTALEDRHGARFHPAPLLLESAAQGRKFYEAKASPGAGQTSGHSM
jgi:3-hydroxyacyl-CoA dehydrogenase / enoyl-CoA hydratase / 3-hydroxybutyryl-CoA epimerase